MQSGFEKAIVKSLFSWRYAGSFRSGTVRLCSRRDPHNLAIHKSAMFPSVDGMMGMMF